MADCIRQPLVCIGCCGGKLTMVIRPSGGGVREAGKVGEIGEAGEVM